MSTGPRDWWAADPEPDEPSAEQPAVVAEPSPGEPQAAVPAVEPEAAAPAPVEPEAAVPAPVEPEAAVPAPVEPTAAVPAPVEAEPPAPAPVETAPVEAAPVEAAPAEPEPPAPAPPAAAPPVVPTPATGGPQRPATPLARAAAASLVIVAVLVAALTTITTVHLADDHVPCGPVGTGQQLAEVATAASSVQVVLSYDYRHLDRDFAAAERLLTPTFRKKYVDTTNKGVKPLAAKYKAITSAAVTGAGLVSTTRGSCNHVLVLVQQTVTNSQLAQPRLDRSRIDVLMVRRNGHWLIGDLNPV